MPKLKTFEREHLNFEDNQNIVDALLIVNCQWLIVGSLPLTINY